MILILWTGFIGIIGTIVLGVLNLLFGKSDKTKQNKKKKAPPPRRKPKKRKR